jgi:hypothetical protein
MREGTIARPGAYGLYLPTLAGAEGLLVDAPQSWQAWQIELAAGSGRPAEFVDSSRARLICEPSGWVDIDRTTRTSTIHLPEPPSFAEIAQPRLGITGVVAAYWRGYHRLHAGAFVVDGRAWGILGSKGDGKTSLLAALASMGTPVLADDVLIIDRGLRALAGPRCIDLRRETALALGIGESIGVVGTRERWRAPLGRVPSEVPLGGFVCLEWGGSAISDVPLQDRVKLLYANRALLLGEQRDPAMLSSQMELFALPMLRMRRPAEIDSIAETGSLLLDAICDLGERNGDEREAPPNQNATRTARQ